MDSEQTVLRPWRADDANWYVAQLADPEIQRFTTESPATTSEQLTAALEALVDAPDQVGFAIVDDVTGISPATSRRCWRFTSPT